VSKDDDGDGVSHSGSGTVVVVVVVGGDKNLEHRVNRHCMWRVAWRPVVVEGGRGAGPVAGLPRACVGPRHFSSLTALRSARYTRTRYSCRVSPLPVSLSRYSHTVTANAVCHYRQCKCKCALYAVSVKVKVRSGVPLASWERVERE